MSGESAPATLLQLLHRIGELWLTYIKGQLLLGLLIGLIIWVINTALGLPFAFLLGALAGVLQTLPGIGPLIAMVPAVIVALWRGSTILLMENWAFALVILGVYLLVQQASQFLIEPHLIGKRLRLHPIIVLVAVIVGTLLANVVGAYLAVPIVATLREVWCFFQAKART